MTEEQTPAPEGEAGDIAVAEVEQTEEPEAVENTEGQEQDPPAKAEEEPSPSKQRRERRKAQMERLRVEAEEAKSKQAAAEARLDKYKNAAQFAQPPKIEDFEDFTEFQAELSAFKSAQMFDQRQSQQIEEEANAHKEAVDSLKAQQAQELQLSWQAQVEEGSTKYTDFAEVAFTAPISNEVADIIKSSDVGADVAYHLGKNPQEAAQISKMNGLDMARAIGRIEASVSTPQPRTQTTAPAPIAPVKPKATAAKDPDSMSMSEYRSWRERGNK